MILDYLNSFFDALFYAFIYVAVAVTLFYLLMGVAVLIGKRRQGSNLQKGDEPYVTVQIPTYNELAALNCAKKCLEFDYPAEKYKIIIGDDSNDPNVSALIDEFAHEHSDMVTVTRRGKNTGYKPGNLNHMLKYSDGELLVIFDSDFLPEKDFLRRIVAPFADEGVSVVQAKWNLHNFSQNLISIAGGTISLICHNIALPFMHRVSGTSFLCGSAEAIRKKDLVAVGGWQAGSLTEDVECSLRLIKAGRRLVYLEDLECKCEAPYTLRDLCRQQMRWAFGVISAFKQHIFDILKGRAVSRIEKCNVLIFASGYLFAVLLLAITAFGLLTVISTRPGPIDWPRFLSETARNISLTSGFILSSAIALGISRKFRDVPRMILSSLSIGLVLTVFVNMGIAKALFNRTMKWFMLQKNGNAI
ncbi:MAG: glycosyltransferase [archaeon]